MAMLAEQPNNKTSLWTGMAFSLACAGFLVVALCYGMFAVQSYWYKQELSKVHETIATVKTPQQQADEAMVMAYKKKIDDVAVLLNNRAVVSGVLAAIEAETTGNVTFSNVDLVSPSRQLRLQGVATTLDSLSLQVQALENNKALVASVGVLNSTVLANKTVAFTLSLVLTPQALRGNATP